MKQVKLSILMVALIIFIGTYRVDAWEFEGYKFNSSYSKIKKTLDQFNYEITATEDTLSYSTPVAGYLATIKFIFTAEKKLVTLECEWKDVKPLAILYKFCNKRFGKSIADFVWLDLEDNTLIRLLPTELKMKITDRALFLENR